MQPTHGSKLENATFAEVTSSTKLQMSFSSYLYCTFILSSYLSKTKLFLKSLSEHTLTFVLKDSSLSDLWQSFQDVEKHGVLQRSPGVSVVNT